MKYSLVVIILYSLNRSQIMLVYIYIKRLIDHVKVEIHKRDSRTPRPEYGLGILPIHLIS